MTDKKVPGSIANLDCIREAVCVHTSKVFDSCRDKDCIEDLRVYCTEGSQSIIDASVSVRPRSAKLLFADVDVEEINFNRGCYTVDVTYFYKVTGSSPAKQRLQGFAYLKSVLSFTEVREPRKYLLPMTYTPMKETTQACPQPLWRRWTPLYFQ